MLVPVTLSKRYLSGHDWCRAGWGRGGHVRSAVEVLDGKGFNVVTIALAVVALILGGISTYYARKALFPPKRQLSYLLGSATALVNQAGLQAGGGAIEVRRNGVLLTDPYLVVVEIKNSGRHAIASEQFDRGRPLELDLNVPIVELMGANAGEHGSVMDACAASATFVSFGPELIRRSQKVIFTVLTEGCPDLEVRDYFVDVKMRKAGTDGPRTRLMRFIVEAAATGSGAAAAAALARVLS